MSEIAYSKGEEKLNILSHGSGFILSMAGLIIMLSKTNGLKEGIAASIFGTSLLLLYAASTLYHSSKNKKARARLRVFDHAAIFVLIAGTYTPVCLITLNPSTGIPLLIIIWIIALLGIVLKVFFTGKYKILSTIAYVGMGWLGIFAIQSLIEKMNTSGLLLLALGGLLYTVGAIIYSKKSIPFNHAIFHFFVLLGSGSHFAMVNCYIL
ncbi:MAG: hemolysin III family protein [Ekhidna sp.]|nr:hemolysin III family protein [Ekhidna sp.]